MKPAVYNKKRINQQKNIFLARHDHRLYMNQQLSVKISSLNSAVHSKTSTIKTAGHLATKV